MNKLVEDIERQIRTLKPEEKAELLRALIADLEGPAGADVERVWMEVARRRHREIVEGAVKAIPATEVFKKGRSRLKR